jgi:hypothetical protein
MTEEVLARMAAADTNLDAAITQSVAADVTHPPEIIGWLAMAVHVRPDDQVAVWWNSGDMDDQQLAALARSLIAEVEGVE